MTDSAHAVAAPGDDGSVRGRSRLRPGATSLTLGLTVALTGLGGYLSLRTPSESLLRPQHGWSLAALVVLLAVAFVVTELGQALVEVRSQAYSFSMSGVPLLLGLLYLPPTVLLTVRVLCAVGVFVYQRSSGIKFAYNTAAYLLDTALVIAIVHHLVSAGSELTWHTAAMSYLALAVVDVVMSSLVLLVIRINQGPFSLGEGAEVLVPAAVFVVLNTAIGLNIALLVDQGALGVVVLATFVVIIALAYRAYLVLRQRHQSLQVLQDFVRQGESRTSVEELIDTLLREIQSLVRATSVELELRTEDRDGRQAERLRVTIGRSGETTVRIVTDEAYDRMLQGVLDQGAGVLISDVRPTPAQREWLAARGIDDALVVPIEQDETRGTLVALDRIGDTTRFTEDDLELLTALAGHFAIALQNRRLLERLQFDANHDVLTGLPNRALITERMRLASSAPAGGAAFAVLLLDLNRFKDVNDALGHHVGDQLLQVVGQRLGDLPVAGATVARLGGDEFAVLLPASSSIERTAVELASHVCESLAVPVDLPDVTVGTGASIGIAFGRPGQHHADLLRHADSAMYAAKDSGVSWEIYTPALDQGRAERLALLSDLRHALDNDHMQIRYQPKLDLERGTVTSAEALVRWTHPTLGPLSPDVFVPLAESTGLIEQLTRVVLAKALADCRRWQDDGLDVAVAVNLSARNVNNTELPEQVALALEEAGLPADQLILEITESSVMGDPDRTVPTLNRLAELGVTLSLDDFGTGYSSLAYLQRLPVREVKIDRSFVLGLSDPVQSHASSALVRSIISLGRSLDLRIVAEGVETQEVLETLRALGCHVIQGHHIGRPGTVASLVRSARSAPVLAHVAPSGG